MKKKLIIAAAIAFAVFAIPYGSSALSTVSVASENNTVVTPSTKPVEEVKNAVDAIDTSKITDAASADNAAVALIKIGSQILLMMLQLSKQHTKRQRELRILPLLTPAL